MVGICYRDFVGMVRFKGGDGNYLGLFRGLGYFFYYFGIC